MLRDEHCMAVAERDPREIAVPWAQRHAAKGRVDVRLKQKDIVSARCFVYHLSDIVERIDSVVPQLPLCSETRQPAAPAARFWRPGAASLC